MIFGFLDISMIMILIDLIFIYDLFFLILLCSTFFLQECYVQQNIDPSITIYYCWSYFGMKI